VGLDDFQSPARRARVVDRLYGNGSVRCIITSLHLDPRPEVVAA